MKTILTPTEVDAIAQSRAKQRKPPVPSDHTSPEYLKALLADPARMHAVGPNVARVAQQNDGQRRMEEIKAKWANGTATSLEYQEYKALERDAKDREKLSPVKPDARDPQALATYEWLNGEADPVFKNRESYVAARTAQLRGTRISLFGKEMRMVRT